MRLVFRFCRWLGAGLLLVGWLGLFPQRLTAQPAGPPADPAHHVSDFAALQAAIATQTDSGRSDQLREFVDVMVQAGRFDQATLAAREALTIAQAARDTVLLCRAESTLGYVAANRGQFPLSVRHYQRALELIRRTRHHDRHIKVLVKLAGAFMMAHDFASAERYGQQALALAQQHGPPAVEASAYSTLSNLAGEQRKHAEAAGYNDRAMAIYRRLGDSASVYNILLNQGICLKNLGRFGASVAAYRQVMRYAEQTHNAMMRDFVYFNLPNTLLGMRQPEEAERYARLALAAIGANAGYQFARPDVYDILTRVKEQQGDFRQALAYHRLHKAYADTIFSADKAKELASLETRYQASEKQARITQLNQENARQARQLGWLGAGALLLLVFLSLTGWQYAVIRRTNAQLHATNQQVRTQHQQLREQAGHLTMLMRELHHRVKNNLAIVSSLLRLQAGRLTDPGAVRAVLESHQRVEALVFIHQRLYQTADMTQVEMRTYVQDLVDSLLIAYGHDPQRFDSTLEVVTAPLEVDLAVPLGLLLNELLTNALKYAYGGEHPPRLRVYLGPDPTDPTASLLLDVADNGPGISPAQWAVGRSFGHRLVASLAELMGGRLQLLYDGGARWQLRVPLATAVATPAAGQPAVA